MNETLENQIAIEIRKIAAEVKALEESIGQPWALEAGRVNWHLMKIENLCKRIRREVPQF